MSTFVDNLCKVSDSAVLAGSRRRRVRDARHSEPSLSIGNFELTDTVDADGRVVSATWVLENPEEFGLAEASFSVSVDSGDSGAASLYHADWFVSVTTSDGYVWSGTLAGTPEEIVDKIRQEVVYYESSVADSRRPAVSRRRVVKDGGDIAESFIAAAEAIGFGNAVKVIAKTLSQSRMDSFMWDYLRGLGHTEEELASLPEDKPLYDLFLNEIDEGDLVRNLANYEVGSVLRRLIDAFAVGDSTLAGRVANRRRVKDDDYDTWFFDTKLPGIDMTPEELLDYMVQLSYANPYGAGPDELLTMLRSKVLTPQEDLKFYDHLFSTLSSDGETPDWEATDALSEFMRWADADLLKRWLEKLREWEALWAESGSEAAGEVASSATIADSVDDSDYSKIESRFEGVFEDALYTHFGYQGYAPAVSVEFTPSARNHVDMRVELWFNSEELPDKAERFAYFGDVCATLGLPDSVATALALTSSVHRHRNESLSVEWTAASHFPAYHLESSLVQDSTSAPAKVQDDVWSVRDELVDMFGAERVLSELTGWMGIDKLKEFLRHFIGLYVDHDYEERDDLKARLEDSRRGAAGE